MPLSSKTAAEPRIRTFHSKSRAGCKTCKYVLRYLSTVIIGVEASWLQVHALVGLRLQLLRSTCTL
ncbi:uncharacterized protein K489DRAFT_377661 [Dissoconium aciculare CBS 342.82]|uniref:Uncharacterized protein n=1 Tax=Dissoconium aciculare CBS 342.82 TaxID=1314786 RepID=A0A6J3MB83_9PEZI|nr:uncharacterized protein K489DRAFT_377661 [Dissoconium aciculare CBS 342.82]KAF1825118.1 hypothetical protein K489DRAFT_377661 [Dissoconium aciculare CBS 342.82]